MSSLRRLEKLHNEIISHVLLFVLVVSSAYSILVILKMLCVGKTSFNENYQNVEDITVAVLPDFLFTFVSFATDALQTPNPIWGSPLRVSLFLWFFVPFFFRNFPVSLNFFVSPFQIYFTLLSFLSSLCSLLFFSCYCLQQVWLFKKYIKHLFRHYRLFLLH